MSLKRKYEDFQDPIWIERRKLNEHAFFKVMGTLDIFLYITKFQKGIKYKEYTSGDRAAQYGHLSLFQSKLAEGKLFTDKFDIFGDQLSVSTSSLDRAAGFGHFKLLKWLYENTTLTCSFLAIDTTAANNRLKIVKWLHKQGAQCTVAAMDRAAGNNHLEMVKWLHRNYTTGCTVLALDKASKGGYVKMVKFLLSIGKKGDNAITLAAKKGYLDIVKLLVESKAANINPDAIPEATRNDHIETVKYLYERDKTEFYTICEAMEIAAQCGYNDILLYFFDDQGIQFTPKMFIKAASHGRLETLKMLFTKGEFHYSHKILTRPCQHGHYDVVKYLLENNLVKDTTQAMDEAAGEGHLDIVTLLYAYDYRCTDYGRSFALIGEYWNVVDFLETYLPGSYYSFLMDDAIRKGSTMILQWLIDHTTMCYHRDMLEEAKELGKTEIIDLLKSIPHRMIH